MGVVKSSAQELGNARVMFPVLSSLFVLFCVTVMMQLLGTQTSFKGFLFKFCLNYFLLKINNN